MGTLYFPLDFAMNLKLLSKTTVFLKSWITFIIRKKKFF